MSSLRPSRWTAWLLLPLLAGALLLMHGLDAGAATSGLHGGAPAVPMHSHRGDAPAEHHDAGCDGCAVGHVVAACVAIAATVVGLRVARPVAEVRLSTLVDPAPGRIRAAPRLFRPLEPAWVRLAVMRC